ncbi:ankyrin repeat domain-containing protein [Bremerella sp. JC817]|uniref:ankyrin repeat domain-containing protein n=1 Tax=Bremerella sp. JC817 TaxID=3231756 RepID=UPI00345A0030
MFVQHLRALLFLILCSQMALAQEKPDDSFDARIPYFLRPNLQTITPPHGTKPIREVFSREIDSQLVEALLLGQKQTAQQLITEGAQINAKGNKNLSILHVLAVFGSEEGTRLAIEFGAKINVSSDTHLTPLALAARDKSNFATFQLLVEKGADLSFANDESKLDRGYSVGSRILHHAYSNFEFHLDQADHYWWYLEHGGDINEVESNGLTPVGEALVGSGFTAAVEFLKRGSNPHVGEPSMYEALETDRFLDDRIKEDPEGYKEYRELLDEMREQPDLIADAQRRMRKHEQFLERYKKSGHYQAIERKKADAKALRGKLEESIPHPVENVNP